MQVVNFDNVLDGAEVFQEDVNFQFRRSRVHQQLDDIFEDGERESERDDGKGDGENWIKIFEISVEVDNNSHNDNTDGLNNVSQNVDPSRTNVVAVCFLDL